MLRGLGCALSLSCDAHGAVQRPMASCGGLVLIASPAADPCVPMWTRSSQLHSIVGLRSVFAVWQNLTNAWRANVSVWRCVVAGGRSSCMMMTSVNFRRLGRMKHGTGTGTDFIGLVQRSLFREAVLQHLGECVATM